MILITLAFAAAVRTASPDVLDCPAQSGRPQGQASRPHPTVTSKPAPAPSPPPGSQVNNDPKPPATGKAPSESVGPATNVAVDAPAVRTCPPTGG